MACDMCGKKGTDLESLNKGYKTDDIQNICPECVRIVNAHLWKIRGVTDGMCKTMLKRFMANYKGEKAI